MKAKERALREWMLDDIRFDWGDGCTKKHTQAEFQRLCSLMRAGAARGA